MGKRWKCKQCGKNVAQGTIESFGGPPEECENCGNDEFRQLGESSAVYQIADDPSGYLSRPRTRRRILVGGGGLAALVGGYWWTNGRAVVEQTSEVGVQNSQFHPRNIEVDVGTEVTWTNEESTPQQGQGGQGGQGQGDEVSAYVITSGTDNWEFEEEIAPTESVSYTFEESGVYGAYTPGFGSSDLTGMSMKIGVGQEIDDPLGGWF